MRATHHTDGGAACFFHADPNGEWVEVTGSFMGWRLPGIPMQRVEDGWQADVRGIPLDNVAYKFRVDGRWVLDRRNALRVPDGSGGENSLLPHPRHHGTLHHLRFHAPSLGENRPYVVYLPPGYYESNHRYPVLYMLHGALDAETAWLDKGAIHTTLDWLRGEGRVGDMIVVMPRENGELRGGDGRYADYLSRDLVGHIDWELRTLPRRALRAIDGLSTGGFTSAVLGATRPDVFGSVGCMSGAYDGRVFAVVQGHGAAMRANRQRYHLSAGHGEDIRGVTGELAAALRGQGIDVEHYENPGPHDWELWRPNVGGNLQFHWANFRRAGL